MYTYLYVSTYAYTRDETKKKDMTRDTYVLCTRAFSDKKGLPTINHAKFFAQFIRVVDTKYEITVFANKSSELPLNAQVRQDAKWSRGGEEE